MPIELTTQLKTKVIQELSYAEDFSLDIMMQRKQLWKKVKRLPSKGSLDYLNYRSIVVKNKASSTLSVGWVTGNSNFHINLQKFKMIPSINFKPLS